MTAKGDLAMVEVEMKSIPLRPGWFTPEEVQSLTTGLNRTRNGIRPHIWRPPTDVYETESTILVRVEIAGMREEDFSISLANRFLSIRGIRQDVPERRAYYQMEILFGEFSTEVELPGPVVADNVTADYTDGFLRLEFPKELPKKIDIKEK
jgi:HSP20 family molecular chaperone IbpA